MRTDAELTVSVTRNTLCVIHPVENTGKGQEGNNAGEKILHIERCTTDGTTPSPHQFAKLNGGGHEMTQIRLILIVDQLWISPKTQ